ncbi:hypothetical protein ACJW31_08G179200 [Castanea mollissima]
MEFSSKAFKEGKCQGQKVVHGEIMPLVLQPPEPNKGDLESLLFALKETKDCFEQMIINNSAVLLRGYNVEKAEGFNEILEIFGWEDIHYVGPAPRTHVYKRIKECPKKVILFCEIPAPEGGETPFVPSFQVTERMLEEFPEAVEEIEEKGLKYTLTALSKNDTSSMRGRGWEDIFGTSDHAEAERISHVKFYYRANALGMDLEWLPNGGAQATLSPRSLTKVFDGRKGRRMWLNTVSWHAWKGTQLSHDGRWNRITGVKRCEEIIEEESIQFKWEKGDVLFFDNMALLHGRRPSLPPRRVLVANTK